MPRAPQIAKIPGKRVGQAFPQGRGALAAAIERIAPACLIKVRDRSARLEWTACHALVAQAYRDRTRRARQCRFYSLVIACCPDVTLIGRCRIPDGRLQRRLRDLAGREGRQLFYIDIHELGSILRGLERFGHDECNGLTHMAYPVASNCGPGGAHIGHLRLAVGGHQRHHVGERIAAGGGKVVGREYPDHARRIPSGLRIDALDVAVADLRPDEDADQGVTRGEIVGVLPPAGDKSSGLEVERGLGRSGSVNHS